MVVGIEMKENENEKRDPLFRSNQHSLRTMRECETIDNEKRATKENE